MQNLCGALGSRGLKIFLESELPVDQRLGETTCFPDLSIVISGKQLVSPDLAVRRKAVSLKCSYRSAISVKQGALEGDRSSKGHQQSPQGKSKPLLKRSDGPEHHQQAVILRKECRRED